MKKEYRTIPAGDVLAGLSSERRRIVQRRAAELIAEEFALRELRVAKKMTQEEVARKLGGRQVYVSRLEKRADMKLSTLRDYVGAIGGKLELVVSFPKGNTVRLAKLGTARPAKSPSVSVKSNAKRSAKVSVRG